MLSSTHSSIFALGIAICCIWVLKLLLTVCIIMQIFTSISCFKLVLADWRTKTCYNVLFHPLRAVPGPFLAKIFPQYMAPAMVGGHRAQVGSRYDNKTGLMSIKVADDAQQSLLKLHDEYGPIIRIGPGEVSIGDYQLYRKIYSQNTTTKEDSFYKATTLLGHENLARFR